MVEKRDLFLGLIISIAVLSMSGCDSLPESTFTLARESRLPKWIVLRTGLRRTSALLTMSYYIVATGRTATFTLQDTKKQTIKQVKGTLKCMHPFQLKDPPQGFPAGYPSYEAVIVDGITEIIEHREMEPVFYVTDNAEVRKQYDAVGCQ